MMRFERKDRPAFESKARLNVSLAEVKFADAEGAAPGTFAGYGSVFAVEDLGGDVIMPGAFKESLAVRPAAKVKMLWQHGYDDNSMPVGVWTRMEEDGKGLYVEGRLIALDTDRGKQLHEGMKAGAIDAMSITYVATDVIYGSKEGEPWRTIRKLDLYEVGPVLFGMNESALIDEAKAASNIKTIRDFETFLRDAGGFSIAAAKAIASGGFKANPTLRDEGGAANDLGSLRERMARLLSKP